MRGAFRTGAIFTAIWKGSQTSQKGILEGRFPTGKFLDFTGIFESSSEENGEEWTAIEATSLHFVLARDEAQGRVQMAFWQLCPVKESSKAFINTSEEHSLRDVIG